MSAYKKKINFSIFLSVCCHYILQQLGRKKDKHLKQNSMQIHFLNKEA